MNISKKIILIIVLTMIFMGILIGLSQHYLRETVTDMRLLILITTGIVLIPVIGAGFILSRMITKPIKSLHYAVETIVRGQLDSEIGVISQKCWEIGHAGKECNKECPAYGVETIACWYIGGTRCNEKIQGSYGEKIADCKKCLVYKKYVGDEFQQLVAALKVMTVALKQSRRNLEKKITLATEDLTKANEELTKKSAELETVNKELEAVNQELDSFTYTASHDLKEPLRGIETFSQFLLEDYANKIDDTGKDYLKRLSAGTARMRNLIDDLLTLSRISRIKNPYTSVDSGKLVEDVIKRLKMVIEEKKVKIEVDDELPFIYCDEVKIREVFYNIVSNAIKYNDKPEPVIKIGAVDARSNSPEVAFTVKDNGIGIKKEHIDTIFQMFRRLHGPGEYGGGTGAGLAIVKKIINDHQGRIEVESEPGKGTVFSFTLPKKAESKLPRASARGIRNEGAI
jgi:signal transduction histidine kinase